MASGIWVDRFTFPFVGAHDLSPWVGKPLTVVWIVAVMNMVNFLDGLDGLAAGVCSIAGGTFAVIALSLGKPDAAIVSAIVFGACLGFLRHNFYPARIFMGDSGAMLLGFVLYGSLERTPLTLEIRNGRLTDATCEREDLRRDFWDYCHTDSNSDRVGELAFGTNLGLREMIGILLQDEKVPGVHIAFGDPYGNQTHADWKSKTHVDVLTRGCDVWIDDEQVIANGQYLLERFALEGSSLGR